MPHDTVRLACSTTPAVVARASSRRAFLLSLGLAAGMASPPLFAQDVSRKEQEPADPVPAQEVPPEEVSAERVFTEELEVVDDKSDAPTEMDPEAVQLLGVAGAAVDPLQAIYALPSVTFSTSDGPGGSDPVIRGSAPQDNAYFIDLVPAGYIFHLFGNSIFDKNVIGSFDLHPAAFSSEYGNATGGIVDVTLREPRVQNFAATLHTSLLTAGVLVESAISDNQSIYATYRRSTMDLLLDEEDLTDDDDEGLRIDELPISDDYQLKYSWRPNENNRFSLVAAGATDTLAATFEETHQEALRDPDFAGPASLARGFDSQGVAWDWRGRGRGLTSLFSHARVNDSLIYGRDQHEKTESDRNLVRLLFRQDLNATHSLSTGLSLEDAGFDLDFNAKLVACNDLDPECSTVDAQYIRLRDTLDVLSHELFLEDRWAVSGKLALTLGLHYGGDDYLGAGRIEPRARLEYRWSDALSTHVAAGRYSQLPELREMIEVLGNPDLTTIKADHYVWGVTQRLGDEWQWNADVYYKDMKDIVVSSGQGATAENYDNGAQGRAYGVELLVRKNLTDRWYGWASLSLSESERTKIATGETVRFEHDKPVLFNLVANRQLGRFWMLGLRWNYQSGGRYTPIVDLVPSTRYPDVLEPVYGELNSEKFPDYHRLDLRAEYTRPRRWGYWKFYVDVLDAYDQENVTGYEYSPNGRHLIPPPPGYGRHVPVTETVRDGFFPSIGFELQFRLGSSRQSSAPPS